MCKIPNVSLGIKSLDFVSRKGNEPGLPVLDLLKVA